MAKLVRPSSHVHAFEPNSRMTALLERGLSVTGFSQRVHINQLALGAENEGEAALVVPPGDPKYAYILPLNLHLPEHATTVPLARLGGRPDWSAIEPAKVDVEGAEQMIWAGA